jgi:hypothetical protein
MILHGCAGMRRKGEFCDHVCINLDMALGYQGKPTLKICSRSMRNTTYEIGYRIGRRMRAPRKI